MSPMDGRIASLATSWIWPFADVLNAISLARYAEDRIMPMLVRRAAEGAVSAARTSA